MKPKQIKPDPLDTFRRIIGGKEYSKGNYVGVIPHQRRILIEFDSDYSIQKTISAKNFRKMAAKEIADIPNPVTVEWFVKHGWEVPEEIQ